MSTKRIVVHLNTGVARQHELVFDGDDDYVAKVNTVAQALAGTSRELLGFTTPFCIYRVEHIACIEFLDPPPPSDKLPLGFGTPKP